MTTRRRSTLAVVLGIMAVMLALVHATAYDANANRPGPTMARFILPDFGIDGVDPFGPFGFSDGNLHYWGKEPPPGGNESFTRECDEIQREITNATLTMTAICGAIGAGLAVVTVLGGGAPAPVGAAVAALCGNLGAQLAVLQMRKAQMCG